MFPVLLRGATPGAASALGPCFYYLGCPQKRRLLAETLQIPSPQLPSGRAGKSKFPDFPKKGNVMGGWRWQEVAGGGSAVAEGGGAGGGTEVAGGGVVSEP